MQGASRGDAGSPLPVPGPPGGFRRFGLAHPRLVDWMLAVGPQLPVIAIGCVLALIDPSVLAEPSMRAVGVWMVAVAVVAGAALLWRRRRPLVVALVCSLLLTIPTEASSGAFAATYVALYSVGAYGRAHVAWIAAGSASVCSTIATAVLPGLEPDMVAPVVSVNLVAIASYAVATLLGISVRARRSYVDQLIARASDLERDRDQQSRLAVAAERARIAREMHDVVSHGLTVMVALAEGSAAQATRDPARAEETMRRVADTGRASLAEMRRLLGVLREPGDAGTALAPQPAAGDLQALVAGFRDAGVPVRLATSGPPVADASLALTVHRILQEALTNAMRHAADASLVAATVRHDGAAVHIEVVDDGSGAPGATTGSGRGIVGMRERVAMFGGSLEAGPRRPKGWRVAATLHAQEQP